MTIHAAKGLEFDTVFLVGWEEGLFPSQRALDEGGTRSLEEERRLAYVAITRARRRAVILHAANRRIYGQWTSSIPSASSASCRPTHIDSETTMTGGASLWQRQLERTRRPLRRRRARHRPRPRLATRGGHARREARRRLASRTFTREPARVVESRAHRGQPRQQGPRRPVASASACSTRSSATARSPRSRATSWRSTSRQAGRKRVMDSFVSGGLGSADRIAGRATRSG